jgi:hypothetical protein
MGKGIAVAMSLIVLFSFLLPWFQIGDTDSHGKAIKESMTPYGYPELYMPVHNYVLRNVSASLTQNVSMDQLYNKDGSITILGRSYLLIAGFVASLTSLVLFGAILGLFGRIGHVLGVIGIVTFTFGVYGFATANEMAISAQPAYFIAFLAFIVGAIAGGSKPKPEKIVVMESKK